MCPELTAGKFLPASSIVTLIPLRLVPRCHPARRAAANDEYISNLGTVLDLHGSLDTMVSSDDGPGGRSRGNWRDRYCHASQALFSNRLLFGNMHRLSCLSLV